MKFRLGTLALYGCLLTAADRVTLSAPGGQKQTVSLGEKVTAVVFLSAVCPISNEYVDRMIQLWRDYSPRDVQFLFVNSNVNETAGEVREHAAAAKFPFPVYRDVHNGLANRLGASITPEAFVVDKGGKVLYQGAFDDARNPARVKVQFLRDAIEDVLAGRPVSRPGAKATGCTIKRERKAS
ncbi:MAG: redoxin domain-containing protein [Acidobacteria bacterium]|nr:redoxin domain-containing protein [Acidobacteriota bacterium]